MMRTKKHVGTLCAIAVLLAGALAAHAEDSQGQDQAPPSARERLLLERIEKLEQRLAALETKSAAPAAEAPATDKDSPSLPGFLAGTTLNFNLDGYYEYNSNHPIGRVNLLRAYDPLSNSFSLNQAGIVIERAPDPQQGRRGGVRLDLMFGQATESLGGSPLNEPRPQVYRNIFQAYGTYVFPVGSGLTVDFGKFASSLGYENTYTKDQMNYSRSYLFTFLPFYHMGFRSGYKFNDKVTVSWLLTNGSGQAEDFNGFKSNHFMLSLTPARNVAWTVNYYVGRENRDLVASLNPGFPNLPTQAGLSTQPVSPRPDGRTHILDTYLSWNPTPNVTLAGEADYVVNRVFGNSAPTHVTGGAGYAKYQFAPKFYMAGRFEHLSDRGGLFSGAAQALKECTLTAAYQPAGGFQLRWEFRRDFSNRSFFLTSKPGLTQQDQNTATLGLLWWFGDKTGSW
jgi:hypothetical protein